MIARLQAIVGLLVLRRENRRLDRAEQRPPLPRRKPAGDDACVDEHFDRLFAERRPPLDPRDVDLWASQILMADPDTIMREATQ